VPAPDHGGAEGASATVEAPGENSGLTWGKSGQELLLISAVYPDHPGVTQMRILAFLTVVAVISTAPIRPASAQVNMQYSGQYGGQYVGQYGCQFSGQFSGRYDGRGSDQTGPNARDIRNNLLGYPVNSGECGELSYPSPGTDYVFHDRQGRRCF
jgi:hypothetical protein